MNPLLTTAGGWLLGHWRDVAIAAAVATLVGACHARDNALRAEGEQRAIVAQQQVALHVADSVNTVLVGQLTAASTRVASDSTEFARLEAKLVAQLRAAPHADTLAIDRWRRDTVYVTGDTTPRIAVPAPAVATADSALHACTEYVSACSDFKRLATARFANDSVRIVTLEARASTVVSARHCGLGAAAGYGAVYTSATIRAGPSVVAGVSCRW